MKNLLSLVFLAFLVGCASSPLTHRLGIAPEGSEYLPAAASVISFSPEFDGFAFMLPPELSREAVCKSFADREGNVIEACRMTFRARASNKAGKVQLVSVYLLGKEGFFFFEKAPETVNVLAADGTEISVSSSSIRKLDLREARYIRANIAVDMPNYSRPMYVDGAEVRVFTGEAAQKLATVPSLVTQVEKNRRCGVYTFSTGEVVGLASGNPIFIASDVVWRVKQIHCASTLETQYFRSEEVLNQSIQPSSE